MEHVFNDETLTLGRDIARLVSMGCPVRDYRNLASYLKSCVSVSCAWIIKGHTNFKHDYICYPVYYNYDNF